MKSSDTTIGRLIYKPRQCTAWWYNQSQILLWHLKPLKTKQKSNRKRETSDTNYSHKSNGAKINIPSKYKPLQSKWTYLWSNLFFTLEPSLVSPSIWVCIASKGALGTKSATTSLIHLTCPFTAAKCRAVLPLR
jgi:hypothetical protein